MLPYFCLSKKMFSNEISSSNRIRLSDRYSNQELISQENNSPRIYHPSLQVQSSSRSKAKKPPTQPSVTLLLCCRSASTVHFQSKLLPGERTFTLRSIHSSLLSLEIVILKRKATMGWSKKYQCAYEVKDRHFPTRK